MSFAVHHLPHKMKASTAAAYLYAQRWQYGNISLQLCYFSGSKRTSRWHKMSIQRFAPSHLPAISAEIMQYMQNMQHVEPIRSQNIRKAGVT